MFKFSFWIKNSAGKKDAVLTFATVSFIVVTLNIILGTIGTIRINEVDYNFAVLDSTTMGVYLGATLTAYVGRKYTDKKFVFKKQTINQVKIENEYVDGSGDEYEEQYISKED